MKWGGLKMTVYCDYDSCEYYEDGCCYNDRIFLSKNGECESYRQKIEEVKNMPAVDIQNSQELIYKKACGVDVEASIEAQRSWEQWRDNVKAIQESDLLETEVEGLYLNFEQDGE